MLHFSFSQASDGRDIPDSSSTVHPGQRDHSGAGLHSLPVQHRCPPGVRYRLPVSKATPLLSAVVHEGGTLKYISSSRFVCCVMVAIPLAATLFAAIIKWRRNKEVSPSAESSCLHSELNLYGTMKSEGSSGTEPAPSTMEENSNS